MAGMPGCAEARGAATHSGSWGSRRSLTSLPLLGLLLAGTAAGGGVALEGEARSLASSAAPCDVGGAAGGAGGPVGEGGESCLREDVELAEEELVQRMRADLLQIGSARGRGGVGHGAAASGGEEERSPSSSAAGPAAAPSLCIFDVDRTLTSRQGTAGSSCPRSLEVPGVWDNAYSQGTLVFSPLLAEEGGLHGTFCGRGYVGIISHGDASGKGSREREKLLERLETAPQKALREAARDVHGYSLTEFSHYKKIYSPYVVSAPDRQKQRSVKWILKAFKAYNVTIDPSRVWFFDDRALNVRPFAGTGYNARQISCASRNRGVYDLGFCGAAPGEIAEEPGVSTC